MKVKVPQREKTLKDELRKQEDSVKEERQEHNTTKQDRQAENKEKTKKGGRKRKSDRVLPVFIDLETTGFGRTADILQIGARLKDSHGHNIVMRPVQLINAKASEVNGFYESIQQRPSWRLEWDQRYYNFKIVIRTLLRRILIWKRLSI